MFSIFGCTADFEEQSISQTEQQKISFERISFDAVLKEINNSNVKDKLSNLKPNLGLTASRGAEEDSLSFIKIIKENEYTTYLREFHSYTQDAPYFLKLIITQDDQETKLGYVKYIPNVEIPYVNINSFTGSIQMLDVNMEIATENYFINGVLQPSSSHNTAARGVDGCTSTTVIITHNCTNGGNHAPGETCGTKKNPLENDGYYEVRLTVFCPGDDPLAEVPEVFIDIAGPSGGSGNSPPPAPFDPCTLINKLQNDALFKQKMINLQTATAYNFESVFVVYNNPTPNSLPLSSFRFLPFNGTISQPKANYPYHPVIKGVMHSHYEGLLSVYSVDDLEDIYLKLLNPAVTDDFFSALVTKSGTRYLLSIADKAKFIAFGNKYLSSDTKIKDLSKLFSSSKYNIKTNTNNEGNEKGFMKMMTELNVGVNVFSGNSDFTEWRKLTYSNSTNTVTSAGCD